MVLAGALSGVAILVAVLVDRTGLCSYVFGIDRLNRVAWVVILSLPFQFLGTFLQFVLLAKGRPVLFAATPAVGQLVLSCLVVGFIALGRLTPLSAAAAWAASSVVTAVALFAAVHRDVRWESASLLPWNTARAFARYALSAYLAGSQQFLIKRLDVLLVSFFFDIRAVGLYSVAYAVAELLLLLPQRLGSLYLPRVAAQRLAAGNAAEVALSSSVVSVGAVIAAAVVSFLAPPAIRLLYGPAFVPSIVPLLLLLPGVCALSPAHLHNAYLCGSGKVSTTAVLSAVALGLNLILNLMLIPRYGISGAAIASSLTYGAQAFLLMTAVARLTQCKRRALLTSASPAVLRDVLRRAFALRFLRT
jgi:O-antigen/teichoic acid export membrane protein